jgi:hypothetical protein
MINSLPDFEASAVRELVSTSVRALLVTDADSILDFDIDASSDPTFSSSRRFNTWSYCFCDATCSLTRHFNSSRWSFKMGNASWLARVSIWGRTEWMHTS